MSNTEMTLLDLFQMKKILDVVCTRGAVKADEMETVGKLYNKLSVILETSKNESMESNNSGSTPGDVNRE